MQKVGIIEIIRFLGLLKNFIGPAVELVEALKEAFKSKEKKFIELALRLLQDENAAEEAERIVADCIRRLKIGEKCLEIESPAAVIDCFSDHVNKLRSKKARNAIYKALAIELARINAPEKYKALDETRWDRLVEFAYQKRKEKIGFRVKNGQK